MITIPRLIESPVMWEMAFTTVHDLDHQITVSFVDEEPTDILIDG